MVLKSQTPHLRRYPLKLYFFVPFCTYTRIFVTLLHSVDLVTLTKNRKVEECVTRSFNVCSYFIRTVLLGIKRALLSADMLAGSFDC